MAAAQANFGIEPVAGEVGVEVMVNNASPNTSWGAAIDESYTLALAYWTKINNARTQWNLACAAATVADKTAALKKLPYIVDLVPRGGSRKRRQSKKRRNHKNHNNNQ